MRKITMMLLFVLTAVITQAQDIIVKNDKTELKVKVLEITDVAIKYKKFEMPDGPVYSILKTEVFMIMYQNGTKEYMETIQPKPVAPKQATPQNNTSVVTSAMNNNSGTSFQSSSSGKKSKHSNWGAELGVLNTDASIGSNITTESVIRLRAGIYHTIALSEKVSLTPALTITGKGVHFSYYDYAYTSNVSEDINISFLEIPFKLAYTTGGTKGLVLGIAPTLGIIISQSEKGTVRDYSSGYTYSFNGSPGFKTAEINCGFSVGYRFSQKLAISLAYNTGLSDLSNTGLSYKTKYLGANFSFGF